MVLMVLTMPTNVSELRHRPADSEKITINLGYVDLGHVDLMVKDGFYSNRTDFIRTAIRNQLDRHADVVRQSVSRKALELGLRHYSRADLEAARTRGDLLHINVLGLASIAHDVTAELARASIASVTVLGALQASSEVKAALADEHTDVATQQGLPQQPNTLNYRRRKLDPVPNWDASQGPAQKAMTMNFSPSAELLEATRLTKAGQLTEATAALQRMLGAGLPVNSVALQGRQGPLTIDGMVDGSKMAQPKLAPPGNKTFSGGVEDPAFRIKDKLIKRCWPIRCVALSTRQPMAGSTCPATWPTGRRLRSPPICRTAQNS